MNALIASVDRLVVSSGGWAGRLWSSRAASLGLVLLLGFSLAIAAVGYFVPKTNWDIFAYLASAHETAESTPQELHDFAYGTVRKAIPSGEFTVLTQDRDYRIRQYEDPDAFVTMLGFYRVKWLYIETIRVLSERMNALDAIRLISAVSALAVGLLAIAWLWSRQALHMAPLAIAGLMLSGYGEVARLGTPDGLSAVFFAAGMLAFLHRREALTALLLFIAFLARPDHVAFIGVLFVVSIFMRCFSWGAVAAFVASIIAYVPITHAAGHPGWWVQMWFTHIEYVGTLAGFDPPFTVAAYLECLIKALVRSVVENEWLAVLILGAAAWWQMLQHRVGLTQRENAILAATLLAVAAKFVVFPLFETRFYFAYLLVFSLTLVGALGRVRFALPQDRSMA